MRVRQRMSETLVVEDAPDRLFGWMCLGLGLFGVLVGGTQGANWLFWIVRTAFVLVGQWILVVARTITHRFDRSRGLMTMDELPSGYRAPTVASDNVPLEVFDEEDSESGIHAGVQARGYASGT